MWKKNSEDWTYYLLTSIYKAMLNCGTRMDVKSIQRTSNSLVIVC